MISSWDTTLLSLLLFVDDTILSLLFPLLTVVLHSCTCSWLFSTFSFQVAVEDIGTRTNGGESPIYGEDEETHGDDELSHGEGDESYGVEFYVVGGDQEI